MLESLIASPLSFFIFGLAWLSTMVAKGLLRTQAPSLRSDPRVRMFLPLLPLLVGAFAGLVTFPYLDPEVPERTAALAGVISALPTVVTYDALKRAAEAPGLPSQMKSVLSLLLERSARTGQQEETE